MHCTQQIIPAEFVDIAKCCYVVHYKVSLVVLPLQASGCSRRSISQTGHSLPWTVCPWSRAPLTATSPTGCTKIPSWTSPPSKSWGFTVFMWKQRVCIIPGYWPYRLHASLFVIKFSSLCSHRGLPDAQACLLLQLVEYEVLAGAFWV